MLVRKIAVIALWVGATAFVADAAVVDPTLLVDITGASGAGTTTWTFSGQATVGTANVVIFDKNVPMSTNYRWYNLPQFMDAALAPVTASSTTATITIDGETFDLTGVGASLNSGVGFQSLGFIVSGGTGGATTAADVGDIVSWTGTAEFPVDLDFLDAGSLPYYETTKYYRHSIDYPDALALRVQIDGDSNNPIPEPFTAGLLALGGAGLMAKRMRRRRNAMTN